MHFRTNWSRRRESRSGKPDQAAASTPVRKGKGKGKSAKKSTGAGLAAEQVREARESSQAKNAEASVRDRMVDIGRGNQQAGRQRANDLGSPPARLMVPANPMFW